jgi:uncharacterized Fe-S cluster-containing radical SAM superfamily protein
VTFRSPSMLRMSKGETCVRCNKLRETVVGAHYTGVRREAYGGGMSIKVHDFCVADLCDECHAYMDRISRDKEGRWGHSEEFQHYVLLTLAKRFESGAIRVSRKGEPPDELERLQRAITDAMYALSNDRVEQGARILRECFWGVDAPQTEALVTHASK